MLLRYLNYYVLSIDPNGVGLEVPYVLHPEHLLWQAVYLARGDIEAGVMVVAPEYLSLQLTREERVVEVAAIRLYAIEFPVNIYYENAGLF